MKKMFQCGPGTGHFQKPAKPFLLEYERTINDYRQCLIGLPSKRREPGKLFYPGKGTDQKAIPYCLVQKE